ncbi:MAG: COX15/CtaA family protein [Blastocatellia bacterium]|nr:COX15/CtaA family protein [Blastocatellia bacterium]
MKISRFAKYAWFVLAFNLAVILLGAYVRASSSGAGCGSHWPLCNGGVIPRSPAMKTLIEFSHRLTSGIALILVVGLLLWAFRSFARRHPARIGASLALLFMLTEALIGAGLVLLDYVAENKSMWRAFWISGHLVNTFLLIAILAFTAWVASTDLRPRIRGQGRIIFALALASTIILGISGAITALGATLFPVTSLAEGLQQDFSPLSHQLARLRLIHPILSLIVSGLLIYTARTVINRRNSQETRKIAQLLISLIGLQLAAGVLNLLLHAPIWLQIFHLLMSDLIWIALVLLTFYYLAEPLRELSFTEKFSFEFEHPVKPDTRHT